MATELLSSSRLRAVIGLATAAPLVLVERFGWILLVFSVALSASAEAQTLRLKVVVRTNSFGGPGGGQYELSCPFGTVMTGLNFREGAWIDALGPICSRYDRNTKRFVGEISNLPLTGGHGGGQGSQRCELPRGVVTHLQVTQAGNRDGSVGSIYMSCGDYLNPSQHVNQRYSPNAHDAYLIGKGGIRSGTVACSPPLVAGGIFGMSGAFIDRVGISCVDYQPR